MAEFQTDIPDPLADDLPCFLTAGCMRTPAVGVLFLVFIRQSRLKGAAMQIQFNDVGGGESLLRKAR